MLTLGMCNINVNAQAKRLTVKKTSTQKKVATQVAPKEIKEYQVGKDGFEWYKITHIGNGDYKLGAEDRYGNMIIPTEYESIIFFPGDNPLLTGFLVQKNSSLDAPRSWYSKSGKCVIPYVRGYTYIEKHDEDAFGTYYTFQKADGAGFCDKNGKEIVFIKGAHLVSLYCFTIDGKKYSVW